MNKIYKLFDRAIKWNAFEALTYQSILTVHQILLFNIADRLTFALSGMLFSFLYLLILILNLGFDKTLAPFFIDITNSRLNFKKLFLIQFLMQFVLLLTIMILMIANYPTLGNLFCVSYKCPEISFGSWIILSGLILSEGIKKSLRMMAQLAFLNKESTIIELFSIILYVSIFWFYFLKTNQISLFSIFSPFILQSIIGLICYTILIIKLYLNLTENKSQLNNEIIKRIIENRFYNFANQISHIFFSGNFLIPFLAYHFGLIQISLLKLTNSIAIFISVILERTFGLTSGALLSHLKKFSIDVKQNAINIASKKLYSLLYGVLILGFIIYNIILQNIDFDSNILASSYLFLAVIIFENFFITYEEFFLVEEKIYYILLTNCFFAGLFFGLSYFFRFSLSNTIFLLLILRILTLLCLRIISQYKLKIKLPYKINTKYTLYYVLLIFIYLIFKFLIYG